LDDLLGGYLKHVLAAYALGAVSSTPETLAEIAGVWGVGLNTVTDMYRASSQSGRAIDGTSGVIPELCRIQWRAGDDVIQPSSFRDYLAQSFGSTKLYRALRYKDRASMWHATELRVPFVDHVVAEFCLSLPASYLVGRGQGKLILREAIQDMIPTRLAYAAKRSVQSPQRESMAVGPLADALTAALESPSDLLSEAVDVPRALAYMRSLNGIPPSNSNPMWQWLNLDRWAKRFL
jgi:asparagine synthase (glutamine-hydrolysing)